jgi:hypothetical protein
MIVEAANPAHSLADSKRMREAMAALDTLVVIDVAMTETARSPTTCCPRLDAVREGRGDVLQLRLPGELLPPAGRCSRRDGEPLPEAEIHARLCEALGAVTEADLAPYREAASKGRAAYAMALLQLLANPRLSGVAPVILYRTMEMPAELKEGAVVFGLVLKAAMASGPALARAGFGGTPFEAAIGLFDAICANASGVIFAADEWTDVLKRIKTPDRKIHVQLPDLMEELGKTLASEAAIDPAFPFTLTAGERRSFTANTIMRDPAWRKKDAGGALRISPADAASLGVASGDPVRLTTRRDSVVIAVEVTDSMQHGHVALPNGLGLGYPGSGTTGVALNELTSVEDRDPFVGTPWHKHVPARVERVS